MAVSYRSQVLLEAFGAFCVALRQFLQADSEAKKSDPKVALLSMLFRAYCQ